MQDYLVLFIKGFIIGIGKIIPGVSGAILAIILGVYEEGVKTINNFFSNVYKNTKFLGSLGSGAVIAIILFSNVIKYMLDNFYLPTMLLFIGLILGGIPTLIAKIEHQSSNIISKLIFLLIFLLVISLSFLSGNNEFIFIDNVNHFIYLVIIGIIDAATMIIPGISGTALLMLLGCYNTIIDALSNLTDLAMISYNLKILIPFVIGIIIGIIITVKIMTYLFCHYETKTYYAIMGFALSSVFLLLVETFNNSYNIVNIIFSLFLLVIGYKISRLLDR